MGLKGDVVQDLDKIRLADVIRKIGLSDLQDGEVICDECQGRVYSYRGLPRFVCLKCRGTGKIDWIDNILWKKGTFGGEDVVKG